jgi:hypothetical protein
MALMTADPGLLAENENARAACEYGPLATSRKRLLAACRCAACVVKPGADVRLQRLLAVGLAHADRVAPVSVVVAALQEADAVVAEANRRAAADVWSVFEGLRAGEAAEAGRRARTVTAAVRWALGTGGTAPPVPSGWGWLRDAIADSRPAPVCAPAWRTTDVLSLARLVREGDTSLLPILADALQDAGCDEDRVLDHCRSAETHTSACWVPDLILDAE